MDTVMMLQTLSPVTMMVEIVAKNQSELNIVIFVIVLVQLTSNKPHCLSQAILDLFLIFCLPTKTAYMESFYYHKSSNKTRPPIILEF